MKYNSGDIVQIVRVGSDTEDDYPELAVGDTGDVIKHYGLEGDYDGHSIVSVHFDNHNELAYDMYKYELRLANIHEYNVNYVGGSK